MSSLLPSKLVTAGEVLQHVSRTAYCGKALYFGRDRTNRYDSPDKTYGVLYLSFDLATALMESVFHQHRWHRRKARSITLVEVKGRMVRVVGVIHNLTLADLTAPGVMAPYFGLNLMQLSSRRYLHTHRVSQVVHDSLDKNGEPIFDGLVYPSRNNFPATCVALFDRAQHKVELMDDIELADHIDWPHFVASYRIGIFRGRHTINSGLTN